MTINNSPFSSWQIARRRCARSACAPLAVSRNTFSAQGVIAAVPAGGRVIVIKKARASDGTVWFSRVKHA
jgi:hypothetical protein